MSPRPDYGGKTDSVGNPSISSLVSSADRLSIRFQNHATLSGEYRVGGDETVSLPVIGRVDIRNLTFEELEQRLSAELLRLTGRASFTTVEVLEYREVFVTGFVGRPGSFPWKRGMMVLNAETLSGGIFRPTSTNGSTLAADAERTRARRAAADGARLHALLARLKAERDDQTTFEAPARMRALVSASDGETILEAQRAILRSRQATFQAQSTALKRTNDVAEKEMSSLTLQRDNLLAIVNKRRQMLTKIEALFAKGIVSVDRVLTDQTRIIELEERISSIAVSMARLQATLASSQRDLEVLELERRANLESETQRVERELAQLEIEVDGSTSTFRAITGQDPLGTRNATETDSVVGYEIVRSVNGNSRTFRADRNTALMPGDVVVVKLNNVSQ